jgi:hypothetical protein
VLVKANRVALGSLTNRLTTAGMCYSPRIQLSHQRRGPRLGLGKRIYQRQQYRSLCHQSLQYRDRTAVYHHRQSLVRAALEPLIKSWLSA